MTRKVIVRFLTIVTLVALTIVLARLMPNPPTQYQYGCRDHVCERTWRAVSHHCADVWVEVDRWGNADVYANECNDWQTRIGSAISTEATR